MLSLPTVHGRSHGFRLRYLERWVPLPKSKDNQGLAAVALGHFSTSLMSEKGIKAWFV